MGMLARLLLGLGLAAGAAAAAATLAAMLVPPNHKYALNLPAPEESQLSAETAGFHPNGRLVEEGKKTYLRYCVGCHGEKGDGDGKAASFFEIRPRNFTAGLFKFRSSAFLPTEQDFSRTIREGVVGTAMPAYPLLPEQEVRALVEFIKTLSPAWRYQPSPEPVALPTVPDDLAAFERVERGRQAFQKAGCVQCHGPYGLGDGPSAPTLKDSWGNPIRARNLVAEPFRMGQDPQALYRTLVTGIGGTPMPSYSTALASDQLWDIVAFVLSWKGEKNARRI